MTTLLLFTLIFALFAASRAFLRYREGKLSRLALLFWTTVWLIAIVFASRPSLTSEVAQLFGIGRGFDFVVAIALMLLFYLAFRLYIKHTQLDQEITKLAIKLSQVKSKKNK